jgi:hypothetical protein
VNFVDFGLLDDVLISHWFQTKGVEKPWFRNFDSQEEERVRTGKWYRKDLDYCTGSLPSRISMRGLGIDKCRSPKVSDRQGLMDTPARATSE